MYEIMSDLGKYLVNRHALCLKGSNMPRPPLLPRNIQIQIHSLAALIDVSKN